MLCSVASPNFLKADLSAEGKVNCLEMLIGAFRRQLGDPKVLMVETIGVLAFGALALGALLADGRLAQYLLAAAWLGHGGWDFAHHRANKVVPRWYAELCAVLDVMVAIGILLAVPYL